MADYCGISRNGHASADLPQFLSGGWPVLLPLFALLADCVTREQQVRIGRIKDFGSAAVFRSACLAGMIWLVAIAIRLGAL